MRLFCLETIHKGDGEYHPRRRVKCSAILGSLNAGVVAVDRSLTVQAWNSKAEDLRGLQPEEAYGQDLLIDIKLPVERLKKQKERL